MTREFILKVEDFGESTDGAKSGMPQELVRCKDCDNRECDGRAGTIVCGITGESHSRLWFCADGERRLYEH